MNKVSTKPPSQQAVISFWNGAEYGLEKVLITFSGRALMIAIGLQLFSRNKDDVMRNALIASGVIEAYLLYHYSKAKNR